MWQGRVIVSETEADKVFQGEPRLCANRGEPHEGIQPDGCEFVLAENLAPANLRVAD